MKKIFVSFIAAVGADLYYNFLGIVINRNELVNISPTYQKISAVRTKVRLNWMVYSMVVIVAESEPHAMHELDTQSL